MTSRFSIAKTMLLDHLETVVRELLPAGRKVFKEKAGAFHVGSPASPSPKWDQMAIWRQGNRRGVWKDFTSGEAGDVIMLVAYVKFGGPATDREKQKAAVEWVEDRFGIRAMDPAKKQRLEADATARREAAEIQAERDRKANHERVRKTFYAAQEGIAGTLAEVYLASRGIVLGDVPNLVARTFRFHPAFDYWMARGQKFPALLSALVDAEGHLRAYHATMLEPDGRGKLKTGERGLLDEDGDPLPTKLMWPEVAGFNGRVTYGPSGLNCRDAAAAGVRGWVGLTEGFEDAFSAAIVEPQLRMHAVGSLSGLLYAPDLDCARGYLVFRDNDWTKPQAVALFDRAMARIRAFGKPVEEVSMPEVWGKDVNDALNHRED